MALTLGDTEPCQRGSDELLEARRDARVLAFGDESSVINADRTKYTVNGLSETASNTIDCNVNPLWIQSLAAIYGLRALVIYRVCDIGLLTGAALLHHCAHTAELEPYFEEEDEAVAAQGLIELANRKGGKDNITAILVRLGQGDARDSMRARMLALKRDVLAKMPLFARLQEREMLRIMQVAEVQTYEPGEVVVKEGDRGDELFIVLSGQFRIVRGDSVLSEIGTGEHFGEMALIRAMPRSATVTATEQGELIALRRADFFEILRKEHELAVKLLWQFLGVLADRLDQTSRDLSNAKTELLAEDISEEIFPDPDEEAAAARASAPPS